MADGGTRLATFKIPVINNRVYSSTNVYSVYYEIIHAVTTRQAIKMEHVHCDSFISLVAFILDALRTPLFQLRLLNCTQRYSRL